jgi:hypothetical protein
MTEHPPTIRCRVPNHSGECEQCQIRNPNFVKEVLELRSWRPASRLISVWLVRCARRLVALPSTSLSRRPCGGFRPEDRRGLRLSELLAIVNGSVLDAQCDYVDVRHCSNMWGRKSSLCLRALSQRSCDGYIHYSTTLPPFGRSTCPEMYPELGLARKTIHVATSVGQGDPSGR